MSYQEEIYIKAKTALDQRKSEAERNNQKRRSAAIMKCPEILLVEQEMAGYAADVIKCIGYGKDSAAQIDALSKKSLAAQKKKTDILVNNGFPEDYLKVDYHCKICNDTGYHDGYVCKCYKDLILQTAREALCSTALLDASSFEKFDLSYYSKDIDPSTNVSPYDHMTNVFNMCYKYAHNFTKDTNGLFFYGKTGLGKTHLSLAIADVVTKKGYNVIYTSAQNAMHILEKEHFGKFNPDDVPYIDKLTQCDLLIMDDLGAEFSTSFTVSQIYNIINTRLVENKPIIISTNLTFDEIEKTYTQRVLSRIIGSVKPVMFFGKDIRQIKRQTE